MHVWMDHHNHGCMDRCMYAIVWMNGWMDVLMDGVGVGVWKWGKKGPLISEGEGEGQGEGWEDDGMGKGSPYTGDGG